MARSTSRVGGAWATDGRPSASRARTVRWRRIHAAPFTIGILFLSLAAGCGGSSSSTETVSTEAASTAVTTASTGDAGTTEESTTVVSTATATTSATVAADTTAGTAPTGETAQPPGTTTAKPEPEKPKILVVDVKDGNRVGKLRQVRAKVGEKIVFEIHSDVADEVHFHGYDISKDVDAGGKVRFSVPATIDGIFEVELESRGELLLKVRVDPK